MPETVSAPSLALSGDGKTATLSYTLTAPGNAWPTGQGQVSIAAGAYADAAGNPSAGANANFTLNPNQGAPDFGAITLDLDFETPGEPLDEGGFDGVLGGPGALDATKAVAVVDGKLTVVTSDGDLSQTGQTDSKNDFVRTIDVSDPALTEIFLSTRFANPFTQAFLESRGVTTGIVPNFAQQGILFAVNDDAVAQNANQFVKVVLGGNSGNAVQLWTQGSAVNQTLQISAMSAEAVAAGGQAFGLFDIAEVELALVVDRAAGTIGQIVTFYAADGSTLGGVRPEATPGFLTAAPADLPAPLAAAFAAGTVDVGVTSTDFGTTELDATLRPGIICASPRRNSPPTRRRRRRIPCAASCSATSRTRARPHRDRRTRARRQRDRGHPAGRSRARRARPRLFHLHRRRRSGAVTDRAAGLRDR